jgi:general secretion pathway protein J
LVELLIAIGIFAAIGLTAYHVLDTIVDAQQTVDERGDALRQLQKTSIIIKKDFLQIVNRPIRSEYGDMSSPAALTTSGLYPVEFSHVGWRNPAGVVRSDVQRVAYEVKEHQLLRHYWNVLDRAQDSKPVTQTLLNGVDEIKFKFMDTKKAWRDDWAASRNKGKSEDEKPTPLPIAVEVVIKTTDYGDVRWLYWMGDADANQDAP